MHWRRQFRSSHEPVPAVVTASSDNQDRSFLREVGGCVRDRLPGTQHQSKTRRASRNREPIGLLHFTGRQNLHGLKTDSGKLSIPHIQRCTKNKRSA